MTSLNPLLEINPNSSGELGYENVARKLTNLQWTLSLVRRMLKLKFHSLSGQTKSGPYHVTRGKGATKKGLANSRVHLVNSTESTTYKRRPPDRHFQHHHFQTTTTSNKHTENLVLLRPRIFPSPSSTKSLRLCGFLCATLPPKRIPLARSRCKAFYILGWHQTAERAVVGPAYRPAFDGCSAG